MFLDDVSVNLLGVILAAILYFVIGGIWYSPYLFGKECFIHGTHSNHNLDETKHGCCACKATSFIGEFIISLILAYVTALVLRVSQAETFIQGMTTAFWLWLGFIATTHFSAVLWARKTLKHYFIHAGFMLVGLLAMSIVLIYFK